MAESIFTNCHFKRVDETAGIIIEAHCGEKVTFNNCYWGPVNWLHYKYVWWRVTVLWSRLRASSSAGAGQ